MPTTAARRRFFSFSLRSLLIATAVVAGVLGWVAREWRIVEDRRITIQKCMASEFRR